MVYRDSLLTDTLELLALVKVPVNNMPPLVMRTETPELRHRKTEVCELKTGLGKVVGATYRGVSHGANTTMETRTYILVITNAVRGEAY